MKRYIDYLYQKLSNRHILFIALWICVALLFQFHKIINHPPLSIHQGAQSDRASIALNYSQRSMNFFEPRVMETCTKDGITPCEFPLINYSVALLYKAFGYSPFWYRFLMWCLMGFGLWAAFDMLCLWLANKWAALLVSFTWFFGGILTFYTPNFLPDTASLAFMLLALRQWFIYQSNPLLSKLGWFAVFAALACLIKITSLVFVIAIVVVAVIQFLKQRDKLNLIWPALGVFLLVFCWYWYCKWLEKKVGGSYFLMNMAMPSSLIELKEWFHIYYANWFFQTYNMAQWLFIGLGIVVVPFSNEKPFLKYFASFSLVGVLCFYLLMAGQFRYHDYYSITLLPVFLFFMAIGFKWLLGIKPFIAYLSILIIGFWGLIDAKNNFRLRYTKGNHLYQTFFEPQDFEGTGEWLTKNGIDKNHKVLAAFDINPNTLLYFLNRQGYRVYDHDYAFVKGKLDDVAAMVTNDSAEFFKRYPETRKRLTYKSTLKNWNLYSVK